MPAPPSRHRLTAFAPYDAPLLLAFLGAHAVPGVESWDGRTYARSLRLPGGPAVVSVLAAANGVEVTLRLTAVADEAAALDACRALLDLGTDPTAAIAHLWADSLLGPLVRAHPGLRVPGDVDPAETAVRAVVGQQVSVAGARTVTGRVVTAHGEPLPTGLTEAGDGITHLFPTPSVLVGVDPASLPMPRARGRTVVTLAQALADGTVRLARGERSADVGAALVALPGIGPWTAAVVALRSLGDPDVFLPTDLGVRRALERLGMPGDPGAATSASLAWRPHRGLALMHLWSLVVFGDSLGGEPQARPDAPVTGG